MKVTKLLVMTEKNIFVYTLFLLLNISDFSLFFIQKLHPLKKVTFSFQATPLKIEILPSPPPIFLENLVGSATPQQIKF